MSAMTFPMFLFDLGRFAVPMLVGLIMAVAGWLFCAGRRRDWEQRFLAKIVLGALLVGILVIFPLAKRRQEILFALAAHGIATVTNGPRVIMPTHEIAQPQSTSMEHLNFKELENVRVLMVHPPARLEWMLNEDSHAIYLGVGFDPAVYDQPTNGADFILELRRKTRTQELFRLRLVPHELSDRGSKYRLVVLPPFEPGTRVVLRTDPGDRNDAAWDWTYLAEFRLIRDEIYRKQQYPGFSRTPVRVEGEDMALFTDVAGRPFLYAASPAVFQFAFSTADRVLELDYGFMPTAYAEGTHGNGAIFRVERKSSNGQVQTLFEHYARPAQNLADRKLLQAHVSLEPCRKGDRVIVSILPGDGNDNAWDHTYLRRVEFK